jgi:hypothetical protein
MANKKAFLKPFLSGVYAGVIDVFIDLLGFWGEDLV